MYYLEGHWIEQVLCSLCVYTANVPFPTSCFWVAYYTLLSVVSGFTTMIRKIIFHWKPYLQIEARYLRVLQVQRLTWFSNDSTKLNYVFEKEGYMWGRFVYQPVYECQMFAVMNTAMAMRNLNSECTSFRPTNCWCACRWCLRQFMDVKIARVYGFIWFMQVLLTL